MYRNQCAKCHKRKNTHPIRRVIVLVLGLVIMFSILLAAVSAKGRIGAHYPVDHPHAVGDTVVLDKTVNGEHVTCLVLYAWEDTSNVAVCSDDSIVSHDPETDSYQQWKGCLRIRDHSYGKHRSYNLEHCYGTSYLYAHAHITHNINK